MVEAAEAAVDRAERLLVWRRFEEAAAAAADALAALPPEPPDDDKYEHDDLKRAALYALLQAYHELNRHEEAVRAVSRVVDIAALPTQDIMFWAHLQLAANSHAAAKELLKRYLMHATERSVRSMWRSEQEAMLELARTVGLEGNSLGFLRAIADEKAVESSQPSSSCQSAQGNNHHHVAGVEGAGVQAGQDAAAQRASSVSTTSSPSSAAEHEAQGSAGDHGSSSNGVPSTPIPAVSLLSRGSWLKDWLAACYRHWLHNMKGDAGTTVAAKWLLVVAVLAYAVAQERVYLRRLVVGVTSGVVTNLQNLYRLAFAISINPLANSQARLHR
eukprot:jgi/Chlat1/3804/Chrsp259S03934